MTELFPDDDFGKGVEATNSASAPPPKQIRNEPVKWTILTESEQHVQHLEQKLQRLKRKPATSQSQRKPVYNLEPSSTDASVCATAPVVDESVSEQVMMLSDHDDVSEAKVTDKYADMLHQYSQPKSKKQPTRPGTFCGCFASCFGNKSIIDDTEFDEY